MFARGDKTLCVATADVRTRFTSALVCHAQYWGVVGRTYRGETLARNVTPPFVPYFHKIREQMNAEVRGQGGFPHLLIASTRTLFDRGIPLQPSTLNSMLVSPAGLPALPVHHPAVGAGGPSANHPPPRPADPAAARQRGDTPPRSAADVTRHAPPPAHLAVEEETAPGGRPPHPESLPQDAPEARLPPAHARQVGTLHFFFFFLRLNYSFVGLHV